MATLRIAVRKFDPFESAIRRQLADHAATGAVDVRGQLEPLELNDLHRRLFEERGLADGSLDIAFLSTDWLAEAQAAGLIEDLTPHLARAPIADFALLRSAAEKAEARGLRAHVGNMLSSDIFYHIEPGLENAYTAFMKLFSGANHGKLILQIAS